MELLIGLLAIAVTIFFGLVAIALTVFFSLKGLPKGVQQELSTIKEAVLAIRGTVEKTWDIVARRFAPSSRTVERELENLGKVKITAEPAIGKTIYLIEIEKPILREEFFIKKAKEPEFLEKEVKLLGKEGEVIVFSPNRLRYYLPSTDPKTCTDFITFLLNWLDSTYVESLKDIKEFEEQILT